MKILLTFDYELFFNDTDYAEHEVLIEPTDLIDSIMRQYGINGTFFVDMSSIIRYKQLGLNGFPNEAMEQIKELYQRGNDIQLHTHPHWYNSYIDHDKWVFDIQRYCLNSFNDEEASFIVRNEKEQLEEILKSQFEGYKCKVYRAGGFCVQPFKKMSRVLSEAGIEMDSSILPGGVLDNGVHKYNFKKCPRLSRYSWRQMDEDLHSIIELPIGVVENKILKFYIWKVMDRLNPGQLKGKPSDSRPRKNLWLIGTFEKIISAWRQPLLLCLDQMHYMALVKALSFIERKNKNALVVLLMHPKFLTESVLENFKEFIEEVKINHSSWEFITINEID